VSVANEEYAKDTLRKLYKGNEDEIYASFGSHKDIGTSLFSSSFSFSDLAFTSHTNIPSRVDFQQHQLRPLPGLPPHPRHP
jgi:hypothetical protein